MDDEEVPDASCAGAAWDDAYVEGKACVHASQEVARDGEHHCTVPFLVPFALMDGVAVVQKSAFVACAVADHQKEA